MSIPTITLDEGPFTGLNLDAPGELLTPGQLQQADNVYLDSGDLVTRPGFEALLTSAFGTGRTISNAFPIRVSGDNYAILAVKNAAATGDELYLWRESTPNTTPTLISGAVLFTVGQTQFAQLREYVFIAGATDGKLYRFRVSPLASAIEATTGLTTPTRTLAAGLTVNLLSALSTQASWAIDTVASPNLTVTDPNLTGGSLTSIVAPNDLSTGWQVEAGSVECIAGSSPYASNRFVRLDEQGSRIVSKNVSSGLVAPAKSNTNGVGSVTRKPIHYRVSFIISQLNANQSVVVKLRALNSGGTQLAEISKTVSPATVNNYELWTLLFSFAGLVADTAIDSVRLALEAGPGNTAGTTTGAYVSGISISAVCADGASFAVQAGGGTNVSSIKANTSGYASLTGTDLSLVPIGDIRINYDLGSGQDWSAVAALTLGYLSLANTTGAYVVNLAIRRSSADAAVEVPFTLTTDGAGLSYLAADITTLPSAYLSSVRYLELHFLSDNAYGGPNYGSPPFRLGPVSNAGALTVDENDYEYRYREAGATTSKASGASNAIRPSLYQRVGYVTVSGSLPENAGAAVEWFRRGGSFPDGLWRRLTYLTTPGSVYTDTYVAWDPTRRSLTDKTPDSALLLAALLTDHDPPPFSSTEPAIAVGEHATRVVVATPTGLYLSQPPQSTQDAGMYWDLVTDPAAVDIEIRGLYIRLSGQQFTGGDTVQRLIKLEDDLVVFFRTARHLLIGTSPANFQIRRYETDRGRGVLAPGAVEVTGGGIWYVSQDGLRAWNGQVDERKSMGIEKAIYPMGLFSGSIDYTLLESVRIALAGGRLFLSLPYDSSDTANSALYVLDSRFDPPAWTRWLLPKTGGGRRGIGCLWVFANTPLAGVLVPTDALYVGTNDGQLLRMRADQGDYLSAGGAVQPALFQVAGRKLVAGADFWVRAERLDVRLAAEDTNQTVTIEVTNGASAGTYTLTYRLQTGQNRLRNIKAPGRVRGDALWTRITAYSYGATRLQQQRLVAAVEGKR